MAAFDLLRQGSGLGMPPVTLAEAPESRAGRADSGDQSEAPSLAGANEGPSLRLEPAQDTAGPNENVPAGSQRRDSVDESGGPSSSGGTYRDRVEASERANHGAPAGSHREGHAGQSGEDGLRAEGQSNPRPSAVLRGKKALMMIPVNQHATCITRFYSLYAVMLKMPFPGFVLCMLSGPILLSLLFTPLYMLDVGSLRLDEDGYRSSRWTLGAEQLLGQNRIRVFLYSLSLSTTLGGGTVETRSPYTILVANFNTLCAQFIFVFISGAVFQRLAQPRSSVQFAKQALITGDQLAAAFNQGEEETRNQMALLTRLVLAGPTKSVLINAKFDLLMRRMVTVPGKSLPFVIDHSLSLVRSEASYLRNGMLLRHIIDESSPLWQKCDHRSLYEEDVSFEVTVSAIERSTMQPVFGSFLYSLSDGDVIFDREYEDIATMDPHTKNFLVNHTNLSKFKPVREVAAAEQPATEGTVQAAGSPIGADPSQVRRRMNTRNVNPGM